jgi:hypothetical protein
MSLPTKMPRELRADQRDLLEELGVDDVEIAKLQAGKPLDRKIQLLAPEKPGKYSPDQPRAPRGSEDGGEWVDAGASRRARATAGVRIVPPFKPHGDSYEAMEQHAQLAGERAEKRGIADQEAIDMYQSTRWLEINDPLRYGTEPPSDSYEGGLGIAETLDGVPPHSPASDIARLDAMMTSEGGLPFDAFLYRGVYSTNVFPASTMPEGYLFQDMGYMSTTTDKDNAMSFAFPGNDKPANIVVVIKARAGQPAILMDSEILLPRGTTLRILTDGRDRAFGARVITAEVVR